MSQSFLTPSGQVDAERFEAVLYEVARQLLAEGAVGGRQGGTGLFAGWGCSTVQVEICADDVAPVLAAGACRVGVAACDPPALRDLAGHIDHTLLKPDATAAQVDALCADALQHGFASVCVNGAWVRRCAEILSGSGVLVCSVIGFPLGAMATEVKAYEARRAIEDGACEIDMVLAVGALKGGDHDFVRRDIAAVANVCHGLGARLKVILETCLLEDFEIVRACELAKQAGADFVKTSTGFSSGGATAEHVRADAPDGRSAPRRQGVRRRARRRDRPPDDRRRRDTHRRVRIGRDRARRDRQRRLLSARREAVRGNDSFVRRCVPGLDLSLAVPSSRSSGDAIRTRDEPAHSAASSGSRSAASCAKCSAMPPRIISTVPESAQNIRRPPALLSGVTSSTPDAAFQATPIQLQRPAAASSTPTTWPNLRAVERGRGGCCLASMR